MPVSRGSEARFVGRGDSIDCMRVTMPVMRVLAVPVRMVVRMLVRVFMRVMMVKVPAVAVRMFVMRVVFGTARSSRSMTVMDVAALMGVPYTGRAQRPQPQQGHKPGGQAASRVGKASHASNSPVDHLHALGQNAYRQALRRDAL